MEDQHNIITEFKVIDEYGNETKLTKELSDGGTENGVDIYFLYTEFIRFLQAVGFAQVTIDKIQFVD